MTVENGNANVKDKRPEDQCPRCGRKMSWLEKEDGSQVKWCYWDQAPFLNTTELSEIFEKNRSAE